MNAADFHMSRTGGFRINGCSQEKCDSLSGHVCGFSSVFVYGLGFGVSDEVVRPRATGVPAPELVTSRKIWYEHIVAAARPSTNPPSYGVSQSSWSAWSWTSVLMFWFWPL